MELVERSPSAEAQFGMLAAVCTPYVSTMVQPPAPKRACQQGCTMPYAEVEAMLRRMGLAAVWRDPSGDDGMGDAKLLEFGDTAQLQFALAGLRELGYRTVAHAAGHVRLAAADRPFEDLLVGVVVLLQ